MRKVFFILLMCAGFTYASAQEVYTSSGKPGFHKKTKREKGYDPAKLVIGGGLNAGYGGGYAVAGISPIVGYRFAKNFTAGVGLGYLYYQAPDDYFSTASKIYYDKEHIIYPNVWARYTIWRGLYASGSFEYDIIKLTIPAWDMSGPGGSITTATLNATTQCALLGLGIKQPLGGRVSFFVEVMHEFLQKQYSPYAGQPIIFRAGVAAGL